MTTPNLLDRRFGKLLVLERLRNKHGQTCWLCRCEGCGKELILMPSALLVNGQEACRSCTHLGVPLTHGGSRKPEYRVWAAMIGRCHDTNDKGFKHYGGRGISVCQRWRNSFQAFMDDMGPRPAGGILDRINNNGNYEPGNVRWTDAITSARNRQASVLLTFQGITLPLLEWAEIRDLKPSTLYQRISKLGWSVEDALLTPLRSSTK